MRVDERLIKGVELFNRGEFFECHEVIERLWLKSRGRYRDFYKGIIQAAVALHHLKRGNLNGARKLFGSSARYLKPYEPRTLGLNVKQLIEDMRRCFRTRLARGRAGKHRVTVTLEV